MNRDIYIPDYDGEIRKFIYLFHFHHFVDFSQMQLFYYWVLRCNDFKSQWRRFTRKIKVYDPITKNRK